MTRNELEMPGPPRAIYHSRGPDETEFTVAFPLATSGDDPEPEEGVAVGEIPGGPALRFSHRGPYQSLRQTYEAITEWLRAEGRIESEADWSRHMTRAEEYVTDPRRTSPDELLTYIYVSLPS